MMLRRLSDELNSSAAPELLVGAGTATSLIAIRDHLDPYDPKAATSNHIASDEVLQIEVLLAAS